MFVALVSVAGLSVVVAVLSYLMPREDVGGRLGRVERVARYIPLQSMKIIIVSWQILTQVRRSRDEVRSSSRRHGDGPAPSSFHHEFPHVFVGRGHFEQHSDKYACFPSDSEVRC